MSEVLLINSPIVFGSNHDIWGDEVTDPPLGLLYIGAYLEKSGISVGFCDVTAQKLTLDDVLNKIEEIKPLEDLRLAKAAAQAILLGGTKSAMS
jgi:hypothetical protein